MKYLRQTIGALGLSLIFLTLPLWASAHATPILYQPESGGRVSVVPEVVSITFSERLEQGASRMTLFYPDGTKSTGAEFGDDPRTMQLTLVGGVEGNYTLSWKVVSRDDGHFTSGAFGFSVGSTSSPVAPATFAVVHRSSSLDAAAVAMELFGEGILLSTILFLVFIAWPLRKRKGVSVVSPSAIRAVRMLGVSGGILLSAGSMLFLHENAMLFLSSDSAETWTKALALFSGTTAGFYAWVQAVAGIILGGIFAVFGRKFWSTNALGAHGWVAIMLIGITVFARSRVSHAAASHLFPEFSVGVNVIHLIGKHGWIDFLLVLSVMTPLLLGELGGVRSALREIYQRADRLLSLMFALTGASGAYIVWLHVKDLSNFGTTLWGTRSLVLLAVTLMLVGLRCANHVRLQRLQKTGKDLGALSRWYGAEFGVGAVVAIVTAVTILTTPPVDAPRAPMVAESRDARIILAPSRTEDSMFLLSLRDRSGKSLSVDGTTILAGNEEAGISDVIIDAERRGESSFVIPVSSLTPEGKWAMRINMKREGTYDAVAEFLVITPVSTPSIVPGVGYTMFFVFCALGAVVLGILMMRRGRMLTDTPLDPMEEKTGTLGNPGLIALCALVATGILAYALVSTTFIPPFQKTCVKEGLMWHSSVPMREAKPTSATARDGCSFHVGKDMYHVTSMEEFMYLKSQFPNTPFVGMDHSMHEMSH